MEMNKMEAKAISRWIRMSPYKVRRVANLVRGKIVNDALNILHFNSNAASEPLEKAVHSAVANLLNKEEGSKLSPEELYVKSLTVDGGFTLKRYRAASMGRASRIRRRTCHVTVVVADKLEKQKA
jgi:large subunit ribosomal protein L22